VTAFVQAESISFSPAYGSLERRLLEESGVLDLSPETVIEMKSLFAQWRNWKANKK
jgi:hypothetical protein